MTYAVLVGVAYLIGSIPFGLIVGKLWGGVDPRRHGSGSMGATNVMRTLGKKAASLVFVLDLGKGIAAVLLAREFTGNALGESLAAVAAIVGHSWPLFAGFRGGRGIALGVGALLTMNLVIGVAALATFVVVLAIKRYVSLASIMAVSSAAVFIAAFALAFRWIDSGYLVYAFAGAALLIWRHRENIQRLFSGREPRIGWRAPLAESRGGSAR